MQRVIILKNWGYQVYPAAMEIAGVRVFPIICLWGDAYGHPRFEDGHKVTTSPIKGLDPVKSAILTQSGSVYILEDINPEFEKHIPDARKFLFEQRGDELLEESDTTIH